MPRLSLLSDLFVGGWVGDYQITGKHGHVLADGAGFLLYVGTNESVRRWTNVKRQLSFCRLKQDGDDEGCLHLDRLPTENEAAAIRNCLRIKRKRHLSPEDSENRRRRLSGGLALAQATGLVGYRCVRAVHKDKERTSPNRRGKSAPSRLPTGSHRGNAVLLNNHRLPLT
jgi:hypothetical protein